MDRLIINVLANGPSSSCPDRVFYREIPAFPGFTGGAQNDLRVLSVQRGRFHDANLPDKRLILISGSDRDRAGANQNKQWETITTIAMVVFALITFFPEPTLAGAPPETKKAAPAKKNQPKPFPPIHFSGKWVGGVKSGALLPVEATDTRFTPSSQNLPVNASVFYGLTDHWLVGASLDWFSFAANSPSGNSGSVVTIPLTPSGNIGSFSTIAVIPSVEYRFDSLGRWSPYLTAGIGLNINTFTQSACPSPASSCSVDLQDALGGRIGAGSDYFVTPTVALSIEIAYLFDATTVTSHETTTAGTSTSYGSVNAATFFILFGVNFKTR